MIFYLLEDGCRFQKQLQLVPSSKSQARLSMSTTNLKLGFGAYKCLAPPAKHVWGPVSLGGGPTTSREAARQKVLEFELVLGFQTTASWHIETEGILLGTYKVRIYNHPEEDRWQGVYKEFRRSRYLTIQDLGP